MCFVIIDTLYFFFCFFFFFFLFFWWDNCTLDYSQIQRCICALVQALKKIIIIIISGIYKAHLISQRTSQCASLLLRYQENHHNHFASTREQLAKCMPHRHLDCNIFHEWYLPDTLRWTRQMRVKCLAQANNRRVTSQSNFFGPVQISSRGPRALKDSAPTNCATVPLKTEYPLKNAD